MENWNFQNISIEQKVILNFFQSDSVFIYG